MEFVIPEDVKKVLRTLEENNIPAFPVGGCVRDLVLGKVPHDIDVAAEATPEELCLAMKDYKTVDVGLSFGTLRVISGETLVEVTCCRSDGTYRDCRRPDSVLYNKNLADDLARRDFTVNAMAYSPEGEIIDLFGGIEDAGNKILRAVGDPETRFREDALRIMRALRFASVLGFDIEEKTAAAVHSCRELLKNIAAERIFTELKKMLCGENVFRILMDYSDVICEIIPEMTPSVGFEQKNPYHIYTVYEHMAKTVEACPENEVLRLAMLFHDIGKPYVYTEEDSGVRHFKGHPIKSAELAEAVLRRLKADNAAVSLVSFLVSYHDTRPEPTEKSMRRYLIKTGYDKARLLFAMRRADTLAQSEKSLPELERIALEEKITDKLEKENACIKISDLEIGGRDIISVGIAPGPMIGEILTALLEALADGECENSRDSLMNFIKERYPL